MRSILTMGAILVLGSFAQASGKVYLECQSKYDSFKVMQDENGNVSVEKATWYRDEGISSTKKADLSPDSIKSNGREVVMQISARRAAGQVKISLKQSSELNQYYRFIAIESDNQDLEQAFKESLDMQNPLETAFEISECEIAK